MRSKFDLQNENDSQIATVFGLQDKNHSHLAAVFRIKSDQFGLQDENNSHLTAVFRTFFVLLNENQSHLANAVLSYIYIINKLIKLITTLKLLKLEIRADENDSHFANLEGHAAFQNHTVRNSQAAAEIPDQPSRKFLSPALGNFNFALRRSLSVFEPYPLHDIKVCAKTSHTRSQERESLCFRSIFA